VFLTTVLKTTRTVPLLCDAVNDSKCVNFDTDIGYFNVYVKYSMAQREGWDRKRKKKSKRIYWNVNFSPDEFEYLQCSFEDKGKSNLVAIICTNDSFTDNKIAILELAEAKKCLDRTTKGGQRRITISRTGNEHKFDCYGVGMSHDKTNINPYVNHMRFFEKTIFEGGF
jgi:hypothetical protein